MSGQPAPGGGNFGDYEREPVSPALNSAGQLAFVWNVERLSREPTSDQRFMYSYDTLFRANPNGELLEVTSQNETAIGADLPGNNRLGVGFAGWGGSAFSELRLNDHGDLAFKAGFGGNNHHPNYVENGSHHGIWAYKDGVGIRHVASHSALETDGPNRFADDGELSSLAIDREGLVSFSHYYYGQISPYYDIGALYQESPLGAVNETARVGMALPGLEAENLELSDIQPSFSLIGRWTTSVDGIPGAIATDADGVATFLALLNVSGTPRVRRKALIRHSDDEGFSVLVEPGDLLEEFTHLSPLGPITLPESHRRIGEIRDVIISPDGNTTIMAARLGFGGGRDTLLRVVDDKKYEILAIHGEFAPGAPEDYTFHRSFGGGLEDTFRAVAVNDTGKVAFVGDVSDRLLQLSQPDGEIGNYHELTGIWTHSEAGIEEVLIREEGYVLPGLSQDSSFRLGSPFASHDFRMLINSNGQIAFSTWFEDNETGESGQGIWAQDRSGKLRLIAMEGGVLDVSDTSGVEDLRVIEEFIRPDPAFFSPGSVHNERFFEFNDRGEVVFAARFRDASGEYGRAGGVFVSRIATIPEPSSVALVAAATCSCLPFRRGRRESDRTRP